MRRNDCEPNEVTFGTILSSCEKRHRVQAAEQMWTKMVSWNMRPNIVHFNTFMNIYAAARQPAKAESKFNDMVRGRQMPDIRSFGSLIKAAGRVPDVSRAHLWLERASSAGERLDARAFASMLVACAQVGDVQRSREILQEMERHGIAKTVVTFTTLARTCAMAGDLKEAEKVIDSMRDANISPSSLTINAMMTACEYVQQPLSADLWFLQLVARGAEVEIVGSNSLLQAWVRTDPRRIVAWLGRLELVGVMPDVISFNVLMNSAVFVLDKDLALEAWARLRAANLRPTLGSYRALSKILARCGDYKQLSEILDAAAKLRPRDFFCERAFLSACANANPKAAKEAEEAFLASQHLLRDDALANRALRLALGDARYLELSKRMNLPGSGQSRQSSQSTKSTISRARADTADTHTTHTSREGSHAIATAGEMKRSPKVQFVLRKAATHFASFSEVAIRSPPDDKRQENGRRSKGPKPRPARPAVVLSSAPEPHTQRLSHTVTVSVCVCARCRLAYIMMCHDWKVVTSCSWSSCPDHCKQRPQAQAPSHSQMRCLGFRAVILE